MKTVAAELYSSRKNELEQPIEARYIVTASNDQLELADYFLTFLLSSRYNEWFRENVLEIATEDADEILNFPFVIPDSVVASLGLLKYIEQNVLYPGGDLETIEQLLEPVDT